LWIGLDFADRAELYRRIDLRVSIMLEQGLIGEIEELLASGVPANCTAMQAIGYKEMVEAVLRTGDYRAGAEEIKLRSRQYAKRQLTWFARNQAAKRYSWGSEPNIHDCLRYSTEKMEEFGI
jgi:tRNA dimethylallyltransferase